MTDSVPATDTPHTPNFELEQIDIYGKYILASRTEILFILRSMQKHGAMASVYFDHNQQFFLTTVLDVIDGKSELILDPGSDERVNQLALGTKDFTVTSTLDKVKIQFHLNQLWPGTFENRVAFRAQLPSSLLRLQRREYFRLETPVANPVRCYLTLDDNGQGKAVDLPLLDISGGGISMMAPLEAKEAFSEGALFQDCRIDLPGEGPIVVTLCIRGIFRVVPRNGNEYLRIGCEFINLPNGRLTLIQRYITRIERERKARLSGNL